MDKASQQDCLSVASSVGWGEGDWGEGGFVVLGGEGSWVSACVNVPVIQSLSVHKQALMFLLLHSLTLGTPKGWAVGGRGRGNSVMSSNRSDERSPA